jgi:hypothetical protein
VIPVERCETVGSYSINETEFPTCHPVADESESTAMDLPLSPSTPHHPAADLPADVEAPDADTSPHHMSSNTRGIDRKFMSDHGVLDPEPASAVPGSSPIPRTRDQRSPRVPPPTSSSPATGDRTPVSGGAPVNWIRS